MGFIPGQRAFDRLMGVDDHPRRAVSRARRRDGERVRAKLHAARGVIENASALHRALFGGLSRSEQVLKHPAHAVEKRAEEARQRRNVPPGHRKQVRFGLFRMKRGVIIQPVRIGFQKIARAL